MDKASLEAGLQEAPEPAWGLTRTTREGSARSPDTAGAHRPGSRLAVSCGPCQKLGTRAQEKLGRKVSREENAQGAALRRAR